MVKDWSNGFQSNLKSTSIRTATTGDNPYSQCQVGSGDDPYSQSEVGSGNTRLVVAVTGRRYLIRTLKRLPWGLMNPLLASG